jgi:transcription initiation factor TFIIB
MCSLWSHTYSKKLITMTELTRKGKTDTEKEEVCTNCGESDFTRDYSRGEKICTSCGLVVSDHSMDTGPEWRAFTAEEKNSRARTGAPMRLSMADKGLSTTIDWRNRDAQGRALTSTTRAAIYRMRKWHIRSRLHGSQQRNLSIAMSEMERLCSQLGVPRDVRETVAMIYRKALSKRVVRGRSIESVIAACIYLACRIHRIPRRLDEVVAKAKRNRKQIGQAVRLVISEVGIHVPLASAIDLIPRIAADLNVKGRTMQEAMEIIKRAKAGYVTIGKDPGGIAGAALYIAGILKEDRHTQRDIAKAARVTEVTIRNRYKDLVRSLDITFPME